MQLKRFEAPTLREALAAVREALGPDALVLSTRSVRREGRRFGRLARPMVEVTAAVDREHARRTRGRGEGETHASLAQETRGHVAPDRSWNELRLSRALVEPLEGELRRLRRAVERLEQAPPRSLEQEISEIRALAARLARAPRPIEDGSALARLRAEAGPEGFEDALAARLDARLRPPREDDAPFALFVGPAGAGKTTTVAKLAARSPQDEAPALVSTDCHRAGGEAALRTLARSLEAPFSAAPSPRSLRNTLRKHGRRRVLIDTAGRSRRDREAIAELAQLRAALGKRGRVHLVLPATARAVDVVAELERYRPLAPDALVLTKLDESSDLSELGELLLDGDAPPLAWLADGQRVPEDLHLPEPAVLAARLAGSSP